MSIWQKFRLFSKECLKQHNCIMANLSGSNQGEAAQRNKQASAAEQHRQKRLNKALRENLLKRKQQSRSRQEQQQKITKDSLAGQTRGKQD